MMKYKKYRIKRKDFLEAVSKMDLPEKNNEWRPVEGDEAKKIYRKALVEYYPLVALVACLLIVFVVSVVGIIALGMALEEWVLLLFTFVLIFISQFVLWRWMKQKYDTIMKGHVFVRDGYFLYSYTHRQGMFVEYAYCECDGRIETGYIAKEHNRAIHFLTPGTRVKVYAIDDNPVCILWDKNKSAKKKKAEIMKNQVLSLKMVKEEKNSLLEIFSFDDGEKTSYIADIQPSSNWAKRNIILTRINNSDNSDGKLYREFEEKMKEQIRKDLRTATK